MARLRSSLLLAFAASLAFASSAVAATTRYVGPSGSGTACSAVAPCSLTDGVAASGDGDELILLPGDYGSPAAPISTELDVLHGVYVHGQDGQPMPRVFSDASSAFLISHPQAVLSRVDIEHSGAGNDAALWIEPGTAREVRVHTTGTGAFAGACSAYTDAGPASLIDSVCWSSSDGTPAVLLTIGGTTNSQTPVLRNLTAIASGSGAAGLEADAIDGAALTVQATNVIARGTPDVKATTNSSLSPTSTVQLDHSDYATVSASGTGATITPAGTNGGQTAAPLFADAAAGDFHEVAGSPTIDAGLNDPLNGLLDVEGNPRTVGTATDIGAYEFVPPPATPAPPAPSPPADHTKPTLVSLKLSHAVFAAAGRGASVTRHRRVPIGTTVSYKLSEPATVSFTVQRAKTGRKSGGKCRKTTPRNKKKRACTSWVKVRGSFHQTGRAGTNHFHFSGRMGGHKLTPASYRLVGVPTDAAHNIGHSVAVHFRIVRR